MIFSAQDLAVLRTLARRYAEIAHLPVMAERRELWRRHHRLERPRPMVLVFPEGSWTELLPESELACVDPAARCLEWPLRHRIYWHERVPDDYVFEPRWVVRKRVSNTGWGLEPRHIDSSEARGAWAYDPVIRGPADLKKLCYPELRYDAAGTQEDLDAAHEVFDGILDVALKGVDHISFHLMAQYCYLRGLGQAMLDMCENPGMVHEAMAFFEEGSRGLVRQYLDMDLLSLNNDDAYHSSGGVGYTDELPKPGCDPAHPRLCDLWASAEAQELAQVGPEMHEEFSLQYERRLLEPFGLNGYGCCEDLGLKMHLVLDIPNIRRVSISPFANVERCAEQLGNRAIFSWKPHPSHLVGGFDEAHLRRYLRHGLDAARGCSVEMILKDTHTCEHHPERFTRWAQIAGELAQAGY
jgi:hypothetical protein